MKTWQCCRIAHRNFSQINNGKAAIWLDKKFGENDMEHLHEHLHDEALLFCDFQDSYKSHLS